jgi:2-hydroxychromene-2-carboxylate isomerase
MDLRRVVAAAKGAEFTAYSDAHMAYFFGVEIDRWAAYRGAPVMGHHPTHHAHDLTLSNCALIAAAEQGADVDALAHAILQAHWRDDADFDDAEVLAALAQSVGAAPEPLLTAARSEAVLATYARNTEEAIARSVFGAPTYFVDGEMFYGQDRLAFVEAALARV